MAPWGRVRKRRGAFTPEASCHVLFALPSSDDPALEARSDLSLRKRLPGRSSSYGRPRKHARGNVMLVKLLVAFYFFYES